ncbi:hypothetical protein [Streptomyces venezuelae]
MSKPRVRCRAVEGTTRHREPSLTTPPGTAPRAVLDDPRARRN